VASPIRLLYLPEGMEIPPFAGYIVEGKYFLVEHASLKLSHVGTVVVQTRRHLLDFGEMTSARVPSSDRS
jgi:hypothetical protein